MAKTLRILLLGLAIVLSGSAMAQNKMQTEMPDLKRL